MGSGATRRARWRHWSLGRKVLTGGLLFFPGVTLLLGGLELALRLGNFGHSTRFYEERLGAGFAPILRENPSFAAPWFRPGLAPRPLPFILPAQKEERSYRLFVLGASAAQGDPEASFSLARQLDVLLSEAYPEIHFEVVNAAVPAINSHVVRRIATDLAALEPDLFIAYMGNNEVIGPFGPASLHTPSLESAFAIGVVTTLRASRTGQLFARLFEDPGDLSAEGSGREMIPPPIRHDDPSLLGVRKRFAANLEAIVRSGARAGARTLLCTVLTNQEDFAPFLAEHRTSLTAAEKQAWESASNAGDAARARGQVTTAVAHYRAAAAIDDTHAGLAFRLGRALLASGEHAPAAQWLARAQELDTLRFRTTAAFNEVVVQTARKASESAVLIDLRDLAPRHSASGLPGDELLYEHVHLSFTGTFEAAQRLFRAVSRELRASGHIDAIAPPPLTLKEMRLHLAFTPHDQAMIARALLARFTAPPFAGKPDQPAFLATWEQRRTDAEALLARPDSVEAIIQLYGYALEQRPRDWVLARDFAVALVALDQPTEAIPLLRQVDALIKNDPKTLFALASALQTTGDEDGAARVFARLRALVPDHPGLPAES
ncbi:MAG: hypothetical protein ACLFU2_03920 [Opitutales bacterium]